MILAVFSILFGTRHLDATERHEGLVAAIAFESIVKLLAFLAAGVVVTYGMYHGFGDLFRRAAELPDLSQMFTFGHRPGDYFSWSLHILLAMAAVLFLPRQFQVTVVENVNEDHLEKAIWLFPLYLLAINVFVLPIALGGRMLFPGGVEADTYVLTLPMALRHEGLTLLVFVGGMSAATGMVIVETVALSTMICNDLIMPVLLRLPLAGLARVRDLSRLVLNIRRGSIVIVLLLAYAYFHFIGEYFALVSIGLISFAAVAQFAPSILGGIFWKRATRAGAMSGLIAGFAVWVYTLVLPTLVQAGILDSEIVTRGPFAIAALRPFQLFGLKDMDSIAHAVFWSLLANTACYVGVSLFTRPSAMEHTQAALFVDVFAYSAKPEDSAIWRGTALVKDLRTLLERFLGPERAREALSAYGGGRKNRLGAISQAEPGLVNYAEKLLAGAIGSASAHVMVSSVIKEEPLGIDEVMHILEETRQAIAHSRELESVTAELQAANRRLKDLDRLKDQFISTVTHELRTPLTAVRSIAEILKASPHLPEDRHRQLTGIVVAESERLTRLIDQVLDFQRIETGRIQWLSEPVDAAEVCRDALESVRQLVVDQGIAVELDLPQALPPIRGDRDRLIEVMINLLSNAVKFSASPGGRIEIRAARRPDHLRVEVRDNGIGIPAEDLEVVFEEFRQLRHAARGRPPGSGLGLSIARRIVQHHGGRIWAENHPRGGSVFVFTLPFPPGTPDTAAGPAAAQ
jgi:signal transduction histidine kinase